MRVPFVIGLTLAATAYAANRTVGPAARWLAGVNAMAVNMRAIQALLDDDRVWD